MKHLRIWKTSHDSGRTVVFWAATVLTLAFLAGPLLKMALTSRMGGVAAAFADRAMLGALVASLSGATWATLIGLLVGTPVGFLLARKEFRGKALIEGLIDLPLVVPHPIAGIALLLVFGRRFFVGGALASAGIQVAGAEAGIVAAMLFVSVPFLINAARDGFRAVDPRLENVARTLGHGPWRAFFRVTLPLARPWLVSGAVMMWARAISEFGAVVVLAYYPMTAPVLIYDRFERFGLEAAKPLATALVAVALVVFAGLRYLNARSRRTRPALP
ncbi:MAG: ABC transporter permease [Deltaproteobacteria bacterium]|jgi:molybdate/tungstate transport system permease protein|nr:ABC transporter permease [Deltaproteobacteria bacterium]